METAPPAPHGGSYYLAAGSLWCALDALYRAVYQGLPPWSIVPPLLFGVAALWNARTNARKLAREKADAEHRAVEG